MAANLTNEITSTDKLPEYISEAEKMGIKILPPHVNLSDPYFSVSADGNIIFGLLGIKGVGMQAAYELAEERSKHGKYRSFIDFLERNNLHTQNKRNLEVMIKTGCFDGLGEERSTLMVNLDASVAYASQKKENENTGQGSLFEGSGIKEFSDFVFEKIEEFPQKEKLRLEKELMGFYISGHPLDEYRKVINNSATLDISHLSRAISKKKYKYRPSLLPETVCGFAGSIDNSNGDSHSFLVDEILEIDKLQQKALSEVHIELDPNITSKKELTGLKDFLYERTGNCDVYIHAKDEDTAYILKTSPQIRIPSTPEFIEELKMQFGVEQIWLE